MYQIIVPVADFLLKATISKVETQIGEQLLLYGVLCIISTLVTHYAHVSMKDYAMVQASKFEEEQIRRYDKLDKISKEKDVFSTFSEKLARAKWATNAKYAWGFMACSSVISSMIAFCYIVITHKQYSILLMFFTVHLFWYYFVTKHMMNQISEKRKDNRIKRSRLIDIISLVGSRFHNGECPAEDYIEKITELYKIEISLDNYWSLVTTYQALPNYVVIILIALFVDKELYIVLYLIANNLTNSISNALGFFNRYNTFQNDLNDFEDFWKDKTFEKEYKQYEIPGTLTICGRLNDFLDVFPKTITQGNVYIIGGLSGAGKSTFVRGLLGFISGVNFSTNLHPLSYRKKIKYMCQDTRGTVPTSKTTIRELFYDEPNDERILNVLNTVELTEWYTNILRKNLDTPIEEKISGGQKTRLCLAIILYKARKENAQWLILDEPDSGLDPELAPRLLKRVLNDFSDMTIFLIVHICHCKLRELGVKNYWHVENNVVQEIRQHV
jgi:ABC-type multidrug transport system fused ATPase/permease subunit